MALFRYCDGVGWEPSTKRSLPFGGKASVPLSTAESIVVVGLTTGLAFCWTAFPVTAQKVFRKQEFCNATFLLYSKSNYMQFVRMDKDVATS